PVEETILRVVRQAEDEVADEPTEREEQHPERPVPRPWIDEPIRNQQEPEPGERQRRRKGRRVRQAPNGPRVKELTVEMQDDARKPDGHREPANDMAHGAPYSRL